ncbi:MAG: methylenetetrahydrofolate--tRNA-(uracil(54)-C(5))-methyltransferase (FADH(2)-oxidizing) TrmFO [Bacilli bacterium]|nr:methylenetetrahydrofolate--tRNA-(uracil(54)-C(5))-methyltransferase (FADH(2)-oxidizing) TrmFO [Bacilli bacterium]
MNEYVKVIGAGLAGSECAYQLAKRGIPVRLIEMRPKKSTEAHKTGYFAELVCSNSLRSNNLENAVGLLKEEMRRLDSLIMQAADELRIPAGDALAVDRFGFSQYITDTLKSFPNVEIINEEITSIPDGFTVIATGPLTSKPLSQAIQNLLGTDYFYFYDAASPIIDAETINYDKVYRKSRYDKGDGADYLNCPMTEEEFNAFYEAVINAEVAELKEFEQEVYFEGCMPFEEMAKRGKQTLLFGPMKPVGLEHPVTGERPFAVVQLRQDNAAETMYNIVGFQTHLKFPEQKRIIRMIPGLENAEILRYGVMHRNSYINSPLHLLPTYQYKHNPKLFFAGQLTGVEGYVESAGAGLVAGINMARIFNGQEAVSFPKETMLGAMSHYITSCSSSSFQPMNANFGLIAPIEFKHKKQDRKMLYAKRSLAIIEQLKNEL